MWDRRRLRGLAADHDRVVVAQRQRLGGGEAGTLGVRDDLGDGVFGAAVGDQQHVQADDEVLDVVGLVVQHPVVDEQRAAGVDGVEGLGDQVAALLLVPVVQHVSERDDVGAGQRVGEEAAAVEGELAGQPAGGDLLLEQRLHGRQVEDVSGQVRLGLDDDGAQVAAGAADVEDGLVAAPVELLHQLGAHHVGQRVHHADELAQDVRVLGDLFEVAAGLLLTGAQRLGQLAPGRVEVAVRALQEAADVGLGAPHQIGAGALRVAVPATLLPSEQAERGQQVEPVAQASAVQPQLLADLLLGGGTLLVQGGEQAQFDCGQQRLRVAERVAQPDDSGRGADIQAGVRHAQDSILPKRPWPGASAACGRVTPES